MQQAQHAHFLRSNKSRSSDGTVTDVLNTNMDHARDDSPSTTVVGTARNSPFSSSTSFSSHTLFTTPSSLPSPACSYADLPSSPPTQADSPFAADFESVQTQTQTLNPTIDYLAARISWPIGVPRTMLGVFRAQPFTSSSSSAAGGEEEAKHVFRASLPVADPDVVDVGGDGDDNDDVGEVEERKYYNLRRGRGRPPVTTKTSGPISTSNKRPRSLSPSPSSHPANSTNPTTGAATPGRIKRRRKAEAMEIEQQRKFEGEMELQFQSRGPLEMFSGSFKVDVSGCGLEGRELVGVSAAQGRMDVEDVEVEAEKETGRGDAGVRVFLEEDDEGEVEDEVSGAIVLNPTPTRMEMLGHEHNPSLSQPPFSRTHAVLDPNSAFSASSSQPFAVQSSPYTHGMHSGPFTYGDFVPYPISFDGHGVVTPHHFMHHPYAQLVPFPLDPFSISHTNNLSFNLDPSTSFHPSLPYFHPTQSSSSSSSYYNHNHNHDLATGHTFYGFLPSLDRLPTLPQHLPPAPALPEHIPPPPPATPPTQIKDSKASQPRDSDGRLRSVGSGKGRVIRRGEDGTTLVDGGEASAMPISGSSSENGEDARRLASSPPAFHLSYPPPSPPSSHPSIPRARAQSGSYARPWPKSKPSTVPPTPCKPPPSSQQQQQQRQPRTRRRTSSSGSGSSGEPKVYECPRPGCERRFELNNGLALHMKSHLRVEEKEKERKVKVKEALEAKAKEEGHAKAKEEGQVDAIEVEMEPVLGATVRGGETKKDTDVAREVGGHGFDRLEDFESMPMSTDADADVGDGSRNAREKMFEGFGLTVDTGMGNSVSGYSTLTGPASTSPTLPSSTSEYFAFDSTGASVPSSATTATSIGGSSFDWASDAVDAGRGSKMGMEMEMEMDGGVGGGGFASSFTFDCEGLDMSQLVGPSLLMPEALEAEFSAFVAQARDQGRKGYMVGISSGALDAMDGSTHVGPVPVENRTHSLFPVSEDVCARLRAEEAITEHANAEVRMYAARAEARARALEPLDPVSCTLFQPLSQHQLEHLASGSDRRAMHAQQTTMGVSGSHSGAGYGGGMMMARGGSGVQERMMLGSEYGHGGTAYPYPAAQSHRDTRGSSGRRSGAGGSARRGGGDTAASGRSRSRNDQTRRAPLAPRLDVPVSRARAPPLSYASGMQGFLDPLEGLGGLGTFF